MKIGFDAKRAYHNNTGLGNYSRTLIEGLTTYYPSHEYFLFNPRPSTLYHPSFENVKEVQPHRTIDRFFSSAWRSSWVRKDLEKTGVELYHGLSNEIPVGLNAMNIPSIVTIHDLIFERFPGQFNRIDVRIYQKKYRYACANANRIIAISEQTKKDIIDIYKIDGEKIDVCYQSCDPAFASSISQEIKERIRTSYGLPEKFFLSVGSVIERKNLLNICRALLHLEKETEIPLVVVGRGGAYLQKVKAYIAKNNLESRVIFLSEKKESPAYPLQKVETLAAIYQMSSALIYPSYFEGFGIPVLEALWSKVPVITSYTSCLPEAGGPGSIYIDPASSNDIASAMKKLVADQGLRDRMISEGWEYAQNFSLQKCSDNIMKVYSKIFQHG